MIVFESLIEQAKARIELLQKQAQYMVDFQWNYYKCENKKKDFGEKSMLFPRIGKAKNGFRIEWHHIKRWYKNYKGEWKKQTRYVAIGRSFKYNLAKYAQAWELPVIEGFEVKAEKIRREVKTMDELIKTCESHIAHGWVAEIEEAALLAAENTPKHRRHSLPAGEPKDCEHIIDKGCMVDLDESVFQQDDNTHEFNIQPVDNNSDGHSDFSADANTTHNHGQYNPSDGNITIRKPRSIINKL
jgi:hypothetical protein